MAQSLKPSKGAILPDDRRSHLGSAGGIPDEISSREAPPTSRRLRKESAFPGTLPLPPMMAISEDARVSEHIAPSRLPAPVQEPSWRTGSLHVLKREERAMLRNKQFRAQSSAHLTRSGAQDRRSHLEDHGETAEGILLTSREPPPSSRRRVGSTLLTNTVEQSADSTQASPLERKVGVTTNQEESMSSSPLGLSGPMLFSVEEDEADDAQPVQVLSRQVAAHRYSISL